MMRTKVLIVLVMMLGSGAAAGTVVKDHVTDTDLWTSRSGGPLDQFLDPDPYWSSVCACHIVGNGERLDTVGVLWACYDAATFTFNAGDPTEFEWVFRFFPDTASFSLDAFYANPPQANRQKVFDQPGNADWRTVLGSYLGIDYAYAQVDVSDLNIVPAVGQHCLLVLIPRSRLSVPETYGLTSFSAGGPTAVGAEYDWVHQGEGMGNPDFQTPTSMNAVGGYPDYFAYRVTTGPLPPVSVSGVVDLGDFTGTVVGLTAGIQFRDPATHGVLDERSAILAEGGAYQVTTTLAPGSYELSIKVSHWLRQTLAGQVLQAGANPVDFQLVNGDCDDSNAVNTADLSAVLSALDTSNAQADLDGDGQVTSTDLAIVLENLDRVGDP